MIIFFFCFSVQNHIEGCCIWVAITLDLFNERSPTPLVSDYQPTTILQKFYSLCFNSINSFSIFLWNLILTWKFIGSEQNISEIGLLRMNSISSTHVALPSQTFLSGQRFSSVFLISSCLNFIQGDHNGHLSSELFWEMIQVKVINQVQGQSDFFNQNWFKGINCFYMCDNKNIFHLIYPVNGNNLK